MSGEGTIKIEGAVAEVLSSILYRVELSNGHRVLAHTSGKLRLSFVQIAVGDRVAMEMSPYDLSKGCIIEKV